MRNPILIVGFADGRKAELRVKALSVNLSGQPKC